MNRFAYISGTGSYTPPRQVSNEQLGTVYGVEVPDRWIRRRTGIESRRFAEPGVGSAEMGAHAARAALDQAGLEARDLDLIIVATLSPEHAFPGSGVYLQRRLGLCEGESATFVPALDVRNQCSGFLYGLSVATAQVRAGMARHVLLVGAETHSAAMDFSKRGRAVTSLFGDAAGAAIVSATSEDRGVRDCRLGADGRHADALAQKVWDIRERPFIPVDERGLGRIDPASLWPAMDGATVFKHAVTRMSRALKELCERAGIGLDELDLVFFHQANLRINEAVGKRLGIPEEKMPHNIERFGNTTAATIPLLLAETTRDGRLRRGHKIALVTFGSGFTWGAALIDW
ncbi:MAG: beta-ketoacyl-ACP synthase III [Thermoanaerobaculia bacterium]|nr:beta-ketoacyl-ACP synthase III [Thermoanaerobaculia bacterium]